MSDSDDFTLLDDCALISRRAELRAGLERLTPGSPGHAALTSLYEKSTKEIDDRARRAWSGRNRETPAANDPVGKAGAATVTGTRSPKAAKIAAVELLLSDPESLQDDVLESCLYILRSRLSES